MSPNKLILPFLILGFLFQNSIYAQQATLTGRIVDEQQNALPNASISLTQENEGEIIAGTASNADGSFSLTTNPGTYTLKISFLSFKDYSQQIELDTDTQTDIGTVQMQLTQAEMDEVVVEGERSYMEMNFDSRTFNVEDDIISLGGSALDVLDNIPSITTDFEGNVSLRGNQGVQVLINGRPSNLVRNGTEALSSIPSSMIEEVKIITNPSARYSADGTGGIIDIVLVDDAQLGFNGSVRANTGWPQDHSIGVNLNYQKNNINWFVNTEFEFERDPRSSRTFQSVNRPDTTYAYRESSDWYEREMEGNINFGADFYLPANQLLTVESRINIEGEYEDRKVNYTDYQVSQDQVFQSPQNNWPVLDETVRDITDDQRESDFDIRAMYEKKFNENDDHLLTADLDFEFGKESEEVELSEIVNNAPSGLQERSFGDEIYREIRLDIDYEQPVGDEGRFEAGTRINYDWEDSDYLVEELQNGNWTGPENQLNVTDNFQFTENVNSAYAIYSGDFNSFTYQVGMRAENTRIETKLDQSGEGSDQNYLNLFPSLFLSYTLNDLNSFQASYSRRISRPRSWYLLPFTEIADNRNQRIGNPNLEPEFSDSYELGYLRHWDSGSILTSVYYRHRTQVIERVSILSDDGLVNTSTPINLATENAWGIELSADQELFENLQLSGSMNLYRSESEGEYQNVVYANETENFTSRLRVRWRFADSWNFQTYLYYRGAQVTTQGRRPARSFVGSALSKKLLDGKANLSINIRDLFNSRNGNREIIEPNRYTNSEFSWSSRQVRLNFRYNFGGDS